jgi:hypothetical protein
VFKRDTSAAMLVAAAFNASITEQPFYFSCGLRRARL